MELGGGFFVDQLRAQGAAENAGNLPVLVLFLGPGVLTAVTVDQRDRQLGVEHSGAKPRIDNVTHHELETLRIERHEFGGGLLTPPLGGRLARLAAEGIDQHPDQAELPGDHLAAAGADHDQAVLIDQHLLGVQAALDALDHAQCTGCGHLIRITIEGWAVLRPRVICSPWRPASSPSSSVPVIVSRCSWCRPRPLSPASGSRATSTRAALPIGRCSSRIRRRWTRSTSNLAPSKRT